MDYETFEDVTAETVECLARLPKPGTIRGSSRRADGQKRRMKLSSSRGALHGTGRTFDLLVACRVTSPR
jgi:hypothetical protein